MRRTVIPPIVDAVKTMSSPRILDVACGTGRTLLSLHRALPHARLYGVDLSPYYIRKAQETLRGITEASLSVENAEALPFADNTFDAVSSTFLFHELPKDARRRVMKEATRVLKPGGKAILLDSAQTSDSRQLGTFLQAFPEIYHEPYFKSYLQDDLETVMSESGLRVACSSPQLFSKRVVSSPKGAGPV
jgi:ubiquinone/menaquinone biosynthesis C-methylase UbiE